MKDGHRGGVADARRRGGHVDGQHPSHVEARVRRLQRRQRDDEHTGARQQHERACDLGRGKHPQATVGGRRQPGAAAGQPEASRCLGRGQPWHVREQHRRGHGQPRTEQEHAVVHGGVEGANGETRGVAADGRHEGIGQQQPEHGAGAAEHEAFGEQGAAEGARTGAQGGAQSELSLSADRPREDQVRDVRARDDEHDGGHGEEHDEDRPRGRRNLIAQPLDAQLYVCLRRVRLRVLAHHRRMQGGQLRPCRFQRDAGRQAAEQLGHAVGAFGHHRRAEVMWTGHHVRDDLRLLRIGHGRLEHADHGGGARTDADGLADDTRVAVEGGGPETMCEDHRTRGRGTVVGGAEQAAEHGPEPHDLEERPVDDSGLHHTRLAEVESHHREVDGGEIAERGDGGGARLEVGDLRNGEGQVLGADALGALADVDQAVLIAIDQGHEEHGPHHAENRRVGPDAEGEGHDHGDGQALGAHEGAQGKPDVPSKALGRVEPAPWPDTSNGAAGEAPSAVEFIQVRRHALLLDPPGSKRLQPVCHLALLDGGDATTSYTSSTVNVCPMLGDVRPESAQRRITAAHGGKRQATSRLRKPRLPPPSGPRGGRQGTVDRAPVKRSSCGLP